MALSQSQIGLWLVPGTAREPLDLIWLCHLRESQQLKYAVVSPYWHETKDRSAICYPIAILMVTSTWVWRRRKDLIGRSRCACSLMYLSCVLIGIQAIRPSHSSGLISDEGKSEKNRPDHWGWQDYRVRRLTEPQRIFSDQLRSVIGPTGAGKSTVGRMFITNGVSHFWIVYRHRNQSGGQAHRPRTESVHVRNSSSQISASYEFYTICFGGYARIRWQ